GACDEQRDEAVVAAVAAREQRHRDAGGHRERESRVRDGRGHPERGEDEDPRGEPQAHDCREHRAPRRVALRPVAHGGEEEARDDGQREAEQHLVAVPGGAAKKRRDRARVLQRPDRDRGSREEARGEVEGAKAQREERRAFSAGTLQRITLSSTSSRPATREAPWIEASVRCGSFPCGSSTKDRAAGDCDARTLAGSTPGAFAAAARRARSTFAGSAPERVSAKTTTLPCCVAFVTTA